MNDGVLCQADTDGDIHSQPRSYGIGHQIIGKNSDHALIYGSGNTRLGEITGKGAEEGRRIRDVTVTIICQPSGAAKAAVNNRGHLIGLDGRKVYCDSDFKAFTLSSAMAH